jgi:hypothetical protein
MKILTFRRFVGLATIGGVAYVHKQRGGDWSLASIQDTLAYLWRSASAKLAPVKRDMQETLDRAANVADAGLRSGLSSEERYPRSYGESSKRKDDTGRH